MSYITCYYILPIILVDGESVAIAALEDIEVLMIGDILLFVIVGMTL